VGTAGGGVVDLQQNLRMQQLQNRSAFAPLSPEPVGFAVAYDRGSGKQIVSTGGSQVLTESVQIAALATGQRVDLTGRRIDYL
jgi:hypothetical protein